MTIFTSLEHAAAEGAGLGDVIELVPGVSVTIGSEAELESAEMHVCVPLTIPLLIADNLTGPCSVCGQMVQFRPHSPKRPPKVCLTCAVLRVRL